MVVARAKKVVKKGQQQKSNDDNDNNNDNNNNNRVPDHPVGGDPSSEIKSRSDLPVLPTRMEVRRARINEKKSKKEIRKQEPKDGGAMKSVVVDASSASSANNPFSAGSLLASVREGGKHKKKLMKDRSGKNGVRGAPSLRSRTETTQNLSDKQREKIFVSEIQNIQKVQEHPAFQADPLGSLQLHLQGTARLLQAPNPECRRAPLPPKKHQPGNHHQQRFNNHNHNNFGGRR